MEGLIPMFLKAIKKNKVRSQYRCLSVGTAQTYNIADFYDDHHGYDHGDKFYTYSTTDTSNEFDARRYGHRRYASTGGFEMKGGYDFNYNDHDDNNGVGRVSNNSPPKQIMKRYRSHRMFSCITGDV